MKPEPVFEPSRSIVLQIEQAGRERGFREMRDRLRRGLWRMPADWAELLGRRGDFWEVAAIGGMFRAAVAQDDAEQALQAARYLIHTLMHGRPLP